MPGMTEPVLVLKNFPNNWYSPQITSIGVPASASSFRVDSRESRSSWMTSWPLSCPPPPTIRSTSPGKSSPTLYSSSSGV